MPIHWMRIQNSICDGELALLAIASPAETNTTHSSIIAKDRATRSRKLNDNAYSNRENAVMAIPTVSNSLILRKTSTNISNIIDQVR